MARSIALLLAACASSRAHAALTLPCTGADFARAVAEPAGDAACDLPWHARLTPAARALLFTRPAARSWSACTRTGTTRGGL